MNGTLALAFTAGMVATVNPCGFALLPAYLSYFLGLEGAADEDGTAARPPVLRALAVSGAVTAGFLLVFGTMGVLWSSVSGVVGQRLPYVTVVIGIGLVGLGIAMLAGFEPTLQLPKLQLSRSGRELGSMFLYGVSYAVASLSCTIGVFIAVVSVSLEGSSFLSSVATFVAYGLGMGMTLSILTIAVALARSGIVTTFRRVLPYVNRISGVLLILAGAFVAYYAWVEIQELNSGSSSRVVQWSRDLQSALQRWAEGVGAARLAIGATIIIGAAVLITLVARRQGAGPSAPGGDADPDTTTA
ncbi:MAG: cytochrome c biogenesis CcdA family protein [Microthrixaceae bacterium]